jgi:hypothetical protein
MDGKEVSVTTLASDEDRVATRHSELSMTGIADICG